MKKQRKPMPKAAVFALIVVGALIAWFAGNTILVKPQKKKAADIQKQITDKQATLDQYRSEAAAAQANVAPKIRVADVYRLARAMPSTEDMPDILIELDDVAKAAGIQLDSISPAGASPGNGFSIVPITVQFSGDYYSITDLLYRLRTLVSVRHGQLEAIGRLFAVKNVTLSPSGAGLSANVSLETYIYGGGAAAAPATTPAVPSTDTTSTDTTSTDTTSTGASAERSTP
jgi:Tfp pilus assembly protein PilO